MGAVGRAAKGTWNTLKDPFDGGPNLNDKVKAGVQPDFEKRAKSIREQIAASGEFDEEQKNWLNQDFETFYKKNQKGLAESSDNYGTGNMTYLENIKSYEAGLSERIASARKANSVTRSVVKEQFNMMKKGVNAKLQTNQVNSYLGAVEAKQVAKDYLAAKKDNRGAGGSL